MKSKFNFTWLQPKKMGSLTSNVPFFEISSNRQKKKKGCFSRILQKVFCGKLWINLWPPAKTNASVSFFSPHVCGGRKTRHPQRTWVRLLIHSIEINCHIEIKVRLRCSTPNHLTASSGAENELTATIRRRKICAPPATIVHSRNAKAAAPCRCW